MRQFDDAYTAPMSGYGDAADYYHRASALRVADRIRLPTLVITADDDPFVPVGPFSDPTLLGNPAVRVVITPHGGHCGFVARRTDGHSGDGYWAERAVVDFVSKHAST